MILPALQRNLTCNNFFIYAACDHQYFDDFAIPLINSIKQNSSNDIHLHIFNPRPDQLEICSKKSISYTYEYVDISLFSKSAEKWNNNLNLEEQEQKHRTINAMQKGKDKTIQERMMKTYFACARFIRLNQIVTNQSVFAIDVDAIVRKTLNPLQDSDLFVHRVEGKKSRFLAGGIYCKNKKFLSDYANELERYINNDYIYWGLDQDILEYTVPKYSWASLPYSYIDWEMKPSSHIWTAKGTRKNLSVFITEKTKYTF